MKRPVYRCLACERRAVMVWPPAVVCGICWGLATYAGALARALLPDNDNLPDVTA